MVLFSWFGVFLSLFLFLFIIIFPPNCSIVFVNDIDRCYRLRLFLEQFGIKSCVLNAELPQNSRYHIVQEFNRGIYDYIIATDEGELMEDPDEDAGKILFNSFGMFYFQRVT